MKSIKLLLISIIALIASIIVSVIVKAAGSFYGVCWVVFHIFKGNLHLVEDYVCSIYNGYIRNLAYLIMQIAIYFDLNWNVGGSAEMLEDFVTHEEDSKFNKPLTTVSAAIGYSEIKGKLIPFGVWFSSLLDKVFMENKHSVNSAKKKDLLDEFNEKEFGNKERLM